MSTVLITGANRGIGLALAERYVARGDRVIATVRNPATAASLNTLAQHGPGSVDVVTCDVSSEAAMGQIQAAAAHGPLDLLINNAGQLNTFGGLDDPAHTHAAWRDVLMANVAGPFFVTRACLPALMAAPGKVAIITSIMGSTARAPGGAPAYRASKAAATNLARNLAAELSGSQIAVGAYHPGWVRTDMGGDRADLSIDESADGLVTRFDALSMATTGVVEDYRGAALAY